MKRFYNFTVFLRRLNSEHPHWFSLLYLVLFTVMLVSPLLKDIDKVLPGRYDHRHLAWQFNVVGEALLSGKIFDAFSLPHFYPRTNTIFYSEAMLTQSLVVGLFRFYYDAITAYNLAFVLTLLLNVISSYALIATFSKKESIRVLGALMISFSQFTFVHLGHHQMITFWPGLFAFAMLIRFNHWQDNRQLIWKLMQTLAISVLIILQFYASHIQFVFFLISISIYLAVSLKDYCTKRNLIELLICVAFSQILLLTAILPYIFMKWQFGPLIELRYEDYIVYAAHLSDYVFIIGDTFLKEILIGVAVWGTVNNHKAGEFASFFGFSHLLVLTLILVRALRRVSIEKSLGVSNVRNILFVSVLIVMGILFSLGPRLQINGEYTGTLLPYAFLIKLPIFEDIRASARWYFLGTLGISLASVLTLNYLSAFNKFRYLPLIVFTVVIFESSTTSFPTHQVPPIDKSSYEIIRRNGCSGGAVLEYPIYEGRHKNYLVNHSYKKEILLHQLYHGCPLWNGDASFDPPDYLSEADLLQTSLVNPSSMRLLNSDSISYIHVRLNALSESQRSSIDGWLNELSEFKVLISNEQYILLSKVDSS